MLRRFLPFAELAGSSVKGNKVFGAYGIAIVELANPDVEANRRTITLPVENKSDFKSISFAQLDSGVTDRTNELILLFENKKGIFGSRKPSIHVAAYPTGTWVRFFEAVENYRAEDFQWPDALFLYQPGSLGAFPASRNLFIP